MGLPAGGVLGVKMGEDDEVVGMGVYRSRGDVVVISEMGVGKRSALNDYPTQGRYGAGVVTASLSVSTGRLAAGVVANVSDRLLMLSEKGNSKAVYVRSLPKARRATQGKELIAIRGRDRLATVLLLSPVETQAVKPASKRSSSRTSSSRSRAKKGATARSSSRRRRPASPSASRKKRSRR
jgi:DNA gyrase subunit A